MTYYISELEKETAIELVVELANSVYYLSILNHSLIQAIKSYSHSIELMVYSVHNR